MIYRLILLWAILLTSFQLSFSQYYDTGEDPAKLKWLQIKTDHFRIIYPKSYKGEALNYARSLDESYLKLGSMFPQKKIRIPVIIHNYTTFSNGYVAWAPRRMELYPTPEQNTIPVDPVKQLTTHELTHVMQMYSLKQGFSAVMPYLFGEQYTGALSALIPMWFMEGDAVLGESLLTGSGRGRMPSFQKQLKAISLTGSRMYSYDKMLLGSFKNYTPDNYQFGFQMVAWTYAKYDQQLWNKTLETTAKLPFSVVPVNLSLSKNAGLTKSGLFSETFDSLKVLWGKDDVRIEPAVYQPVNPDKKRNYINYYSPVVTGTDSVVAIKTSLTDPPSFVLISTSGKTEKRIFTPGEIYPWFISGAAGKIVWVEKHPDVRWTNRDYSVLKILDIKTRIARQLTHSSRIMSASISPDGKYIAASENSVDNRNTILIIDPVTGNTLNKTAVPQNDYPQRLQWSANGAEITMVSLSDNGEGIISYSLESQQWRTLIEPSQNDLQSGFLRNDTLFFVSSASGTDNIYMLTPEKKLLMISNSRFGAYDMNLAGSKIYFSDYSPSGSNLCETNISCAVPAKYESQNSGSFLINRFDTISFKNSVADAAEYKSVPYRKILHPIRFHSWMPFYADLDKIQADPTAISPGVTLMSQNDLSTLLTTVGYEYAGKEHFFHSKVTWKGWFPVLESKLDWGGDPEIEKNKSSDPDPSVIYPGLRFTNTIYLPLSFSTGKFSQYLQTSVSSVYLNRYVYIAKTASYDYGQTQVNARLYFFNYQRSGMRDIYPRWGQLIDFNYTSFPFDKSLYGDMSTLKTAFYFPGFIKNHSIKLRFEAEKQNPVKYILYNRASFPRSYTDMISEKLNLYSADYAMPLLYPDLNIPGVAYLKRVRTTLFYDYARGTNNTFFTSAGRVDHKYTETFRSFGVELLGDFYLLRIPFMISGGVQAAWKDVGQTPAIKLLLKIDVYGMKIGSNRMHRNSL